MTWIMSKSLALLQWVMNGCAENMSGTSEVPQLTRHFVQRASRQKRAKSVNERLTARPRPRRPR